MLSLHYALPVLDVPGVGVDRRGVALRDRPGAVAAVLRCVARRIGGEGVAVGGRGETPDGALMAVSELVLALDRPAVVEVGDRVVAADGEAVLAEHRVEGEGRAGGEAGQQHPCGEAA